MPETDTSNPVATDAQSPKDFVAKTRNKVSNSVMDGDIPTASFVDAGLKITSATGTKSLHLCWEDGGSTEYSWRYLRATCYCSTCYTPKKQRLMPVREMVLHDVSPPKVAVDADGLGITCLWEDGHKGLFSTAALQEIAYNPPRRPADAAPFSLWDKTLDQESVMYDWADVEASEEGRLKFLLTLQQYGMVLLKNLPVENDYVLEVGKKIGAIMHTTWGEVIQMRVDPTLPGLVGFSHDALLPHCDTTYLDYNPNVQLFHCIEKAVSGGESVIVNSISIMQRMREEHPRYYKLLSTVPLLNHHLGYRSCKPVVRTDSADNPIRFEMDAMHTSFENIPADVMDDYLLAFRTMWDYIDSGDFTMERTLQPGEGLIWLNTKLMHSRWKFDPSQGRLLQGCYVSQDEFRRTLRQLSGKVSASIPPSPFPTIPHPM